MINVPIDRWFVTYFHKMKKIKKWKNKKHNQMVQFFTHLLHDAEIQSDCLNILIKIWKLDLWFPTSGLPDCEYQDYACNQNLVSNRVHRTVGSAPDMIDYYLDRPDQDSQLILQLFLSNRRRKNSMGHFTLARLGARLGFQAEPEPSH